VEISVSNATTRRVRGIEPLGLLLVLAALLACAHNNASQIQAVENRTAAQIRGIRADFAKRKLYATCSEPRPQGSACGLVGDAFWTREHIEGFASECSDVTEKVCWAKLRLAWYELLWARYTRGTLSGGPNVVCPPAECPDPRQEELAILRDHNASITRDEYLAVTTVQSAAIDAEKALELQAVQQQRADRAALSRSLQSIGDGFQASQPPPGLPETTSSNSGCTSDYQCSPGQVCAKDSLAFRGVCATSVNPYGVPTYAQPDPASVQPGTGACSFDTECPIGFRCVKTSGGLKGNCMK
jgi:hypothetical protein